jgi:hypothetical protein
MPTATLELAPLPPPTVSMFERPGILRREWYIWFQGVDVLLRALRAEVSQALDDIEDLTP